MKTLIKKSCLTASVILLALLNGYGQCTLFSEPFTSTLGQFTSANNVGGSSWSFTSTCTASNLTGHTAPGAAIFQSTTTLCQYGTAANSVSGNLSSTSIFLPSSGTKTLTFKYYLVNECAGTCTQDVLSVMISTNGGSSYSTILSSASTMGSTNGSWIPISYNLAAYSGMNINIRFNFYTPDGLANNFDGVYVDDVTVSVSPTPTISVTPSSVAICAGGSTTLTASGASSYSWIPAAGLSATTGSTVTANPTVTTTYTVTGSFATGCTNTATTTVTVNPSPTVTVSPASTSTCAGNPTTLNANGAATYSWSPPDGLNMTSGPTVTATPTVTTTYTVTGTSAGCTNTATATVTITPGPAPPTAGSNSPLCEGTTLNLTASTISGATYEWSGPGGYMDPSQNPSISGVTASHAGTYSVTVMVGGCTSAPATVNVIINAAVAPVITSSGPTTFCDGGSVDLVSTGNNHLWTTGETTQSITVTQSGTFSVTATDANGCIGTSSGIAVTVNPNPAVNFMGLNSGYCLANPPSTLVGNPAGGIFTGPGVSGNSFDPAMAGAGAHTVMYAYTDANGCSGSESQMTIISNNAFVTLGPDTMVCNTAPPFILIPGSFSEYLWHDNSTGSSFTVNPPALGIGLHTFYVDVTDVNGCMGVDSIEVNVSGCVGFSEAEIMQVSVLPNPTNGILNLTIGNCASNALTIKITNIAGQVIFEKKNSVSQGVYSGQLDLSAFAKGIYYLDVNDGLRSANYKIVLQ